LQDVRKIQMHNLSSSNRSEGAEYSTPRAGIAGAVRAFILEESNVDESVFTDDTDLLELGVVDSLLMVSLVTFCETEFAISIEVDELSEENFKSIAAVAEFVEGKL
jgi:acyl carrier protein